MKSRHLYWLLLFGLLLALFFTQKIALASCFTETRTDYTQGLNLSGTNRFAEKITLTQQSDFSKVIVYFKASQGSPNAYVNVSIRNDDNDGISYHVPDGTLASSFATSTLTSISGDSWNTFNFQNSFSLPAGNYFLEIIPTNSNSDYYVLGASATHPDPPYNGWYYPLIGSWANWDYFGLDLTYQFDCVQNSVIINPIATSTEAISFDWQYHLNSATTSNGYYTIFPRFAIWRQESEFVWFNLGYDFGTNYHANSTIATGTTAGFNLDAGHFYQIKGFYLKYDAIGDGSINASTTMVDSNIFYVSSTNPFVPIITMPTSTITSSTIIQTTCDPDSGLFSYSICSVIRYLFYPDAAVLNLFSGLTAPIQTKPPLGYFTSIKNALTGLTSSTPAFTIDVNDTDPVKTTFFTPIRTGLMWILWLAFAFWVFHRFRHFNFTSP